jgi:tRNA threonylcarbamoyladenosine biosynthesis protein TsaB
MYLLCLETSGTNCSVSLYDHTSHQLVIHKEHQLPNEHSKVLMPTVDELLKVAGVSKSNISAIGLSSGPGSYTGLRIGSAAAKGMCMGLEVPLVAVSSLEVLNTKMQTITKGYKKWIPMFDARRMEVYMAVFDHHGNRLLTDTPHVLSPDTPLLWDNDTSIVLGGSGAPKVKQYLMERCGLNVPCLDVHPDAASLATLVAKAYQEQRFINPFAFEPQYLKPFYTTAKPLS